MKTKFIILAIGLTLTSTSNAEGINWGKVKDGLFTYVLNPMLQTNNPELMRGKVIGQDSNSEPSYTSNMSAGQIKYGLNFYENKFDRKVAEYVEANRNDLDISSKIKILCEAESAAIGVTQFYFARSRKDLPTSLLNTVLEKYEYYDQQRKEMVYEQQRVNGSNVNCFDYAAYK